MISIKLKNPLFTYYLRFVNILDFNPKKLSIEKVCAVNDNDLKGYFKYSKEKDRKELEFIIEDQSQAKIYDQIWDKVKELSNSIDGVNFGFNDYFRDHSVIRFDTGDDLPLDAMVSIYSMTIIIRSVYKTCCNRFYPQIYLANCIYKKC